MPTTTVELKLSEIQTPIISRYGRVQIAWASGPLNEVLAGLQREREQCQRNSADKGEAISNSLLDQAEQIKRGVKLCH